MEKTLGRHQQTWVLFIVLLLTVFVTLGSHTHSGPSSLLAFVIFYVVFVCVFLIWPTSFIFITAWTIGIWVCYLPRNFIHSANIYWSSLRMQNFSESYWQKCAAPVKMTFRWGLQFHRTWTTPGLVAGTTNFLHPPSPFNASSSSFFLASTQWSPTPLSPFSCAPCSHTSPSLIFTLLPSQQWKQVHSWTWTVVWGLMGGVGYKWTKY